MKYLTDAPALTNLPPISYERSLTVGKGRQIMESMLLNQYQNSTNLKEYYMAFFEEMDFLFSQIEAVYSGRFLDVAVGAQLDVIGTILQQPRSVALPTQYFGFQGAVDVAGMADAATSANGGIFRDGDVGDAKVTPLDDATYRKVLYAKAIVMNSDTADINQAYYVISILLGRIPSIFEIRDQDSGIGLAKRHVDLLVSFADISPREVSLILYMSKYFVPAGITFTITQV